ncbi:uncharacterized protein NECHADRAFT_95070 [Fusarium vanettenii 77-13-4]|uniref:ASST-domain-containing protein n=1 Tax=Fusarium vanettenii (strain ATCC MYA-4622 / CBS 123669 / FGSC 9596 / NRRL 45880 / 77-13-4) TaxID=660122 RepID=C7YX48_FUSV7|nr:uncharacterized protein NECHADRAFT_95070 [Fusarium vanettenii 77-13-4]EEU43769.1 hypothetical protein NECHADRAFT_95070 [Fusarium vanettenii 77-13-4]
MKPIAWSLSLAATGLASFAAADWQYRSRPDLAVPRLNITVPADRDSAEKGYIFITLYEGFADGHKGPVQPGAYIFRDNGELVWSGLGYHSGWVANFVPDTWNGQTYLRAFQGKLDGTHGRMYGYHVLLGSDYEVAKVVRAKSPRLTSAHEFRLVDGRTALIENPTPRVVSLKSWGGDEGQNWVLSGGFQGMYRYPSTTYIETGDVLFEWQSFDHVDPKCLPGSGRNETDAWNYFHINSVDKDDEGNYLLSARNIAAIFKINGTSGDIIWQLGGFHGGSSFQISQEDRFSFQHHARFHGRSPDGSLEFISLFDNGAHSAPFKTHPFSRARYFQLDHNKGTAKALKTFDAPDGLSAHTQGSVQILPNKNFFVNWGQAGAVTEFNKDGKVLFHSYLDSAPEGIFVQSYRGFRANWTGNPSEEPAVAAFKRQEKSGLDVYASWNGDTEAASWRFYARSLEQSQDQLLGEFERKGFETHAELREFSVGGDLLVTAEAVDVNGKVLTRTNPVVAQAELDHLKQVQKEHLSGIILNLIAS